jgi:hypothetical protein
MHAAFNAFPTIEFKEIGLKSRDANGYNLHAKVVLDNPTPVSATLVCLLSLGVQPKWTD